MPNPSNVGNDKIYELVDRTRLELKSDNLRLESKFDALADGRLAQAEAAIAKLRVKEATLSLKVYALVFIISSIWSSIVAAIALKLLGVGPK